MIYRRVLKASNGRQHLHNYFIFSRIAYTQRWPLAFCTPSSAPLIRSRGLSVSGCGTGPARAAGSLNYNRCSQTFPLIRRHFLMSPHLTVVYILMGLFSSSSPASPCSPSRRAPRPARICPSAYHACYPSPSRPVTTIITTTTTTRSTAAAAPAPVTTTITARRARRRSCCSRRTRTWPPISWPPALPTRRTGAPQLYTRIRICIPRRRQRPPAMCYVCRPSGRRSPGRCRRCIMRRWPIRRSRIGWQVS